MQECHHGLNDFYFRSQTNQALDGVDGMHHRSSKLSRSACMAPSPIMLILVLQRPCGQDVNSSLGPTTENPYRWARIIHLSIARIFPRYLSLDSGRPGR